MAAFAKIFSDLVTSDVSTVATWQIGSGSPKARFGSVAVAHYFNTWAAAIGKEQPFGHWLNPAPYHTEVVLIFLPERPA